MRPKALDMRKHIKGEHLDKEEGESRQIWSYAMSTSGVYQDIDKRLRRSEL